jgi:hypothetical protein
MIPKCLDDRGKPGQRPPDDFVVSPRRIAPREPAAAPADVAFLLQSSPPAPHATLSTRSPNNGSRVSQEEKR